MKVRVGQIGKVLDACGQSLDYGGDELWSEPLSGGLELFGSAVDAFEIDAVPAVRPAARHIGGERTHPFLLAPSPMSGTVSEECRRSHLALVWTVYIG